MTHPTLFDNPPASTDPSMTQLVHRDDPATSREAIERHASSGERARHLGIVLDAVRRYPLRTAMKLVELCELDEYPVRRRLSDLKRGGYVVRGPKRKCRIKGTSMVVWEVAR